MKKNESKIEITVELDENKIPEKILWSASDGGILNEETKAAFLSVWKNKVSDVDVANAEAVNPVGPATEAKIGFREVSVLSDTETKSEFPRDPGYFAMNSSLSEVRVLSFSSKCSVFFTRTPALVDAFFAVV